MTILGIDPGVRHTGWALVNDAQRLVDSGTLAPKSTMRGHERHCWTMAHVLALVVGHEPRHVVYEEFVWRRGEHFVSGRPEMERLIGAIQMLSLLAPYPVVIGVRPAVWGNALLGTSQHAKDQIAWVVNQRLGTTFKGDTKDNHESDSCGLALWWCDQGRRKAVLAHSEELAARHAQRRGA
jgi:Holliday junction resolvasome RuvABC endonuclease subunit